MRASSLFSDERGAAVTELGVLLLPLCVLLLGLLDVGYMMYARSVLQGALNDVARAAVVEDPDIAGTGTLEERIQAAVQERMEGLARGAPVNLNQNHFDRFSRVGKPEKLITDRDRNGEYDEADGDCFQDLNNNGDWDESGMGASGVGGAEDVAVYTASTTVERLLPIDSLINSLPIGVTMSPSYTLAATAAVRNQPYETQATPPVVCGS